MAFIKAPSSSALTSGFDLWILPEPKWSQWARKLDWHLNFQVTRSLKHSRRLFSKELQDIVSETCSETLEFELKPSAPILIISQNLLPNKQSVVLPHFQNINEWMKRVHQTWSHLNSPSTKIFVPKTESPDSFHLEFQNTFPENANISYLLDTTSGQ